MTISAQLVKSLRDKTGAGMMDCKNALSKNSGDIESAVDWLRTKGLAKAAKKAGRVTAEGLIGIATDDHSACIVEVNSETDFVARNEQFQDFVRNIAKVCLKTSGDKDAALNTPYPGSSTTVAETITETSATIGENMGLRRAAALSVSSGVVAHYIHNAVGAGLGKIGVLVSLESNGDKDKVSILGQQIAMHIAATNPLALNVDSLDASAVEKEREIFAEQARQQGKPDAIIEKMVEGRIRKYYEEVVLLKQTFVIDGENTLEKAVELASKDIGEEIVVTGFICYKLGEGIEKEEADFAAEVAAAVQQS